VNSPKDKLADNILWKRARPTFAEVHLYGWTDESACKAYINSRYRLDGLSKAGITRRTNKLWTAAKVALRVSNNDYVEGSLWCVSWDRGSAFGAGDIPKLSNRRFYSGEIFESPSNFEKLGYVSAPDEKAAMMAAMVTLGPRAHTEHVRFNRLGVGDWARAQEMNRKHAECLQEDIEKLKKTLKQKAWELENIECQIAFLNSGSSFESKNFPVPEESGT
jgi:hypothetical protein